MVTRRAPEEKLCAMIKFLRSRTTNALPHGGLADALYADALIIITDERDRKQRDKDRRKTEKEIRHARELLAQHDNCSE
jgi:hypothetical protein